MLVRSCCRVATTSDRTAELFPSPPPLLALESAEAGGSVRADACAATTVVNETNGKEALLGGGHGCRLHGRSRYSAAEVLQSA